MGSDYSRVSLSVSTTLLFVLAHISLASLLSFVSLLPPLTTKVGTRHLEYSSILFNRFPSSLLIITASCSCLLKVVMLVLMISIWICYHAPSPDSMASSHWSLCSSFRSVAMWLPSRSSLLCVHCISLLGTCCSLLCTRLEPLAQA